MNLLFLKGYNNYFNRILKKENSIADYKTACTIGTIKNYLILENMNFNPNDGIATVLIVGKGDLNWETKDDYTPDYLVTYTEETVEEVITQTIQSRWFVLEIERTRGGQYKMALKRDVLADHESEIMEAPCFVEKGTITDAGNPLLFNAEGMKFNEIKVDETLLKDNTKSAWLVGYLKKDINDTVRVLYTPKEAFQDVVDIDGKDWYPCINYINADGTSTQASKVYYYMNKDTSNFCWKIQVPGNSWPTYVDTAVKLRWDMNGQNRGYSYDIWNGNYQGMSQEAMIIRAPWWSMGIDSPYCKKWSDDIINKMLGLHWDLFEALKNDAIAQVNTQGVLTTTSVTDILEYNGKYFEKDNKIYKLTIGAGNKRQETVQYNGSSVAANALWNCVLPDSRDTGNGTMTLEVATANPTKPRAKFIFDGLEYSITAQEVVLPGTIDFTMAAESSRNNVEDAVYNMFCMPVHPKALGITSEIIPPMTSPAPMYIENNQGEVVGTVEGFSKIELAVATELCKVLGGNSEASKIYDLQLVPYCPIDLPIVDNHYFEYIDTSDLVENQDYQWIKNSSNDIKGIIFYPNKANFSKNIPLNIKNESEYYEWQTVVNPVFKYNNQTWDGYPLYRFAGFRYGATDGTHDINVTDNLRLTGDFNEMQIRYLDLYNAQVEVGPVILLTSPDLPLNPSPSQQVTIEGSVSVLAHWLIPDRANEVKKKNECDFQRIVSPNYNGMFQFKQCRLNEGLHYINVDCTYKPYTPYIKLNPDFSGLYGQDWNDSTGLICGGDFSIPMMNNAFTNYALQNKNYQEIFSRQIENLDVNQQIAREQQQFQGIVGIATAGIGGGVAGAIAGSKAGPWGAAIGAAVGGVGGTVASYLGYEKDKDWLEQQQGEARSFAIDEHNYQLGNIKAIPQSMTKSSPLSYNNKIWPILERYTCTDAEKQVLDNKLRYDGMTVMAIGTLTDYSVTGGFLKGKLIRLPTLKDDFHLADVIYQEVDKGFYTGE